jgi:hypothetical protein
LNPEKLRRRAVEYAAHGWPVVPLAVPRHGRCPCEKGTCATPHLAGPEVTDPEQADETWAGTGWSVALTTSRFDVIDIPARFGGPLHQQLLMSCPTATAPHGRRWHFVMETGSVPAEVIATAGGTLHTGPDDWIAASPTWTEDTGRVGWVVPPQMARWQPWQRRDVIDLVFGSIGTAPNGLPKLSINVRFP